ncbi:MAG: hypothetical protein ACE5JU_25450 [Candidatus Binatia bacterium]
MADLVPGVVALVFGAFVLIDACLLFLSYIYSRFIFNRYLMKHHREKWEELVYTAEYQGLNLFSFDKTPQLRKFRSESDEDLGDPSIRKMRTISIYLFKTGILVWISLVVIFLVAGLAFVLSR